MTEFEQSIGAVDWHDVGIVVMATIGKDASWPRIVRSKTNAPILAYEPRGEVRDLYKTVDHCCVADSIVEFRSSARDVADNLYGAKIVVLCDDEDDEEILGDVTRAWQEADVAGALRGRSDIALSGARVGALLESIDLLVKYPPLNLMADDFKGIPAIVVGAGPSLDSQLDALKSHRGLIIAVNSSWPALHKAGITPDLVLVCEAKPVGKTMADLPLDQVVMGPGLHVGRDTWDLPWKRIAPVLSHEGAFGPWATSLFGVPPAAIGGSAACLGVGVAYLLGCDPILLVGCDCAPSEAGQLYSSGAAFAGTTVSHDESGTHIVKSDSKLSVEDVGRCSRESIEATVETRSWDRSHFIKTTPIYDSLRQWLEETADAYRVLGRRTVNASVGGAHISGWEHISAEEALAGKPTLNPLAPLIHEALSCYDGGHKIDLDAAIDGQIAGCERLGARARDGVLVMAKLAEAWREISDAGVEIAGADTKTWNKLEREHGGDGYVPAFDFLASALSAKVEAHPRCAEAAALCAEARKLQLEIGEPGSGSDLIDAYAYGPIEASRHGGDRPAVEVFAEIFAEIERGAAELLPLLRAVKERLT